MAQAIFTPKWLPTTDIDGLAGRRVLVTDANNQRFLLRIDRKVGERPQGSLKYQWTYTDRVKVDHDYKPEPDVLELPRSTAKRKYDPVKQKEYTRKARLKKKKEIQPQYETKHSTRAGAPVQRERKGKSRGWFSKLLGRKGGT